MPTATEMVEQFDKANGKCVRIDNWLIFANGAMREVNLWGALIDPPEKEYARLKIVERYHKELLRRAVVAFDALKNDLVETARANQAQHFGAPCRPEDAAAQLEALLRPVRIQQRRLAATRSKLAKTPEGLAAAEREEQRAESIAQNEHFVSVIKGIRI